MRRTATPKLLAALWRGKSKSMPRPRKRNDSSVRETATNVGRIIRPLSLAAQVEQVLRQAIAEGRWAGSRLPTEVALAEQLGVSRETVCRAADVLQRDGERLLDHDRDVISCEMATAECVNCQWQGIGGNSLRMDQSAIARPGTRPKSLRLRVSRVS